MSTRLSQQGMAVVVALLIMALAASAAAIVVWQQGVWWHQQDNDEVLAKLRSQAVSDLSWVQSLLDQTQAQSPVNYLGQSWAGSLSWQYGDAVSYVAVTDEQGRFNLNSLVVDGRDKNNQIVLYRQLLATLGLPSSLADTLADWLDPDNKTRENGAETPYYLSLTPPYHAANAPLPRVGALRWVKGYTPDVIKRLRPYVSALPAFVSRINVNTAPDAVLKAMMPNIQEADLKTLMALRTSNYFKDVSDFQSRIPVYVNLLQTDMSVSSAYFLMDDRIVLGNASWRTRAEIYAEANHAIRLIWRADGLGDNDE